MPFCNFVQTYKMQRSLLILLSSFFLCISCRESANEGILPQSKMTELMTEVHLIDAYLNTLPVDSSRKVIGGLYEEVFRKFDLDSTSFTANLNHYLGNAVASKTMYEDVNKNLTAYEAVYLKEDSVRQAFYADSVRRQMRLITLKELTHKLIFEVEPDTIPYSYKDNARSLMESLSLSELPVYGLTIDLVPITRPVGVDTTGVQAVDSLQGQPIEAPTELRSLDSNETIKLDTLVVPRVPIKPGRPTKIQANLIKK